MSMLDEFKSVGSVQTRDIHNITISFDNGDATDFLTPISPKAETESSKPLFSLGLGTFERKVTRGRGQVVAVDCSRDVVVVATSRNYILRYDYQDLNSSFQGEVEIGRSANDSKIQRVFLHPSTHHLLVNLHSTASGFETHYIHSSWNKSKPLPKLRGLNLVSVGWGLPVPSSRNTMAESQELRTVAEEGSDQATRESLIADQGGVLYSCILDIRERSSMPLFRKIFDFKEQSMKICEVAVQSLTKDAFFVLIVTNTALYVLSGGPTLEAVFSVYNNGHTMPDPVYPLPMPETGSHLLLGRGAEGWPERFAWMIDSGIYSGRLSLSSQITTAPSDLVDGVRLWSLERAEEKNAPVAMATTEFHYILMFAEYLLIVNRINRKLAQKLSYGSMSRLSGNPTGLATDLVSGIVYLFTSDSLIDVGSKNEDKDIWRVYMDMQDFGNALSVCRTQAQRDEVYITQAEQALSQLETSKAARLYAKVTGSATTFEEIALKFIELKDSDALYEYLSTKLETLGNDDKAQKTMVASWLTELHLDKINQSLMKERGEEGQDYKDRVQELRQFLSAQVSILDVNTTVGLLAGYGRIDDLMHFAESRNDHEALLECLMQRRDVRRALGVMRLPSVSREIVYKFAPDLMSQAPALAVEFWVTQDPALEPRRLLPALVAYGEQGSQAESWKEALRYVEFSVNTIKCQDSALHNLAIALYSQDPNETLLVDFIKKSASESVGDLLFDGKYALRLIRERGRHRACVVMLCVLGMYEDAVSLALTIDLELAKSVAQSKDLIDSAMKRKLWLAIARHVIEHEVEDHGDPEISINNAVSLLEEAGDLVRIEDILPFFPDFVTIDKFQRPIRNSLDSYNRRIDDLKAEMTEATEIADALRKDLKTLETRTAVVTHDLRCARCGGLLTDFPIEKAVPTGGALPPFYVFPSGLAYHGACLCAEYLQLSGELKQTKIFDLVTRLASVQEGDEMAPDVAGQPQIDVKTLQRQLDAEIASECPRNGEITLRMIDQPFVRSDTRHREESSWTITLRNRP